MIETSLILPLKDANWPIAYKPIPCQLICMKTYGGVDEWSTLGYIRQKGSNVMALHLSPVLTLVLEIANHFAC